MQPTITKIKDVLHLMKNRNFNQFEIFEDIFRENAISKILQYLLDSESSHLLGSAFSIAFLESLSLKKLQPSLNVKLQSLETYAFFNKSTDKGRFIDIVVECFDRECDETKPVFVFGIETKKWDSERIAQLQDYQNYLARQYSCPSILIYLTPHGKEGLTADLTSKCPYKPLSYKKVSEICQSIKAPNEDIGVFVRKFGEFMSANVAGKVDVKIKDEIKKLWSEHKHEMRTIANYGKSLKNPRTFIYEKVINHLNIQGWCSSAFVAWHYPRGVAAPKEFNIAINQLHTKVLKKKNFSLYFMIHSESDDPVDQTSWRISLAMYPEGPRTDKTAKADAIKFQSQFKVKAANSWSPWCFFESSELFTLDYQKSSSERSLKFISDYIEQAVQRITVFYKL